MISIWFEAKTPWLKKREKIFVNETDTVLDVLIRQGISKDKVPSVFVVVNGKSVYLQDNLNKNDKLIVLPVLNGG